MRRCSRFMVMNMTYTQHCRHMASQENLSSTQCTPLATQGDVSLFFEGFMEPGASAFFLS
jgi:hypothetical protein